jgi:dTDP-4-amino-4,6-dideoxygalactose transaminase
MLRRRTTAIDGGALRLARPSLPPLDAYVEELAATWEDAWLSNFGPRAERFERVCADYAGLRHVRAVSNCDVGLTLAVRAFALGPGDRVIVPSLTFPSTLHALLWNGLEPRFAEVDPDTWCLTAESAASAIDGETAAIVGTHAFMSACDVAGLEALAADLGAVLIFDAAQAIGTWVGGRHVGTFGDASVFSFSPAKVATSGEGGLASFRDADAAERFGLLREYGSDSNYDSRLIGLNGKLSELHAALGCLTVAGLEEEVAARQRLVERYERRVGELDGVRLQAIAPELRPTPTMLVADFGARRDDVASALSGQGIESRAYFRPLHAMDRFSGLPAAPLPVTERLGVSLLALPLHRGMDDADVDLVCDTVESALGYRRPQANAG